jgi:choice-of-anchor A domain-containing protein
MAINFGLANEYNVFVFGNMSLSNTDAEGRVAVGGNAVLSNYGIGANITPLPPANTDPSFVVNGDVNVSAGSNASGNTVISPTSNVIQYTMGNPNGSLIVGTPIDFAEAERYLKCASVFWSTLAPNGTGTVVFGQLNLTGTDETLNVFRFDSQNIYGSGSSLNQLNGINIIAPVNSTILITVDGANIQYGSYQIFRNGVAASRTNARKILWNFPSALTWSNSTTAIYGSVLAPFADATTTFSQINGNIIFESYTGNAESHNELFIGELPDPITCLLTTTTTSSTSSTTSTTSSTTSTTSSTTSTTSSTTSSTSSTTSTTSSTTTTSTTTSTTSTTTTTTAVPRAQAISDLFESIALQQTALSHILNAEGEKLQKILSFDEVDAPTILRTNQSVEQMVDAVSNLETILKGKLDLFFE